MYQNLVVAEGQFLSSEWDVQNTVTRLNLSYDQISVVNNPSNVQGFAILALASGYGVRWNIATRRGQPLTVKVAKYFVIVDSIFGTSPWNVGASMAGLEFAGNQSTIEVGPDDVQRLSVVFTAGKAAGRNLSAAGRYPALRGETATWLESHGSRWACLFDDPVTGST